MVDVGWWTMKAEQWLTIDAYSWTVDGLGNWPVNGSSKGTARYFDPKLHTKLPPYFTVLKYPF